MNKLNKHQKEIIDYFDHKSTINLEVEKNLGKVMEKPQEQIHFENLYLRHKSGWWRDKPFESLGNIIHWLYVYGTMQIAENCIVGDGYVKYHDFYMKFKFTDENPHMPYFYDLNDEKYDFILKSQEYYLNGLKKFPIFVVEIDEKYNMIKR